MEEDLIQMPKFSQIDTWTLPVSALENAFAEMAIDGRDGNEGVTLWLGKRGNGRAEITHSVVLRGPGVIKRPAYLNIEPDLLNDVADLAIELDVSLVGQIHSHGHGYSTDLSLTDRNYGIRVPYYLSLVAPDYAMNAGIPITDCGVHVYERDLRFRRFSLSEVDTRIKLVGGIDTPVLTVGEV